MEKGETLKIFVCETFVVVGDPIFVSPAPLLSIPRNNPPMDIGDLIVGMHGYARPPTVSFYQVRTLKAAMN